MVAATFFPFFQFFDDSCHVFCYNPDMKQKTNLLFLILLGIAGSVANNGIMWLSQALSLGLYLDIIFTIAVVFLAGLLPGIICAVLTTGIYSVIYYLVWGSVYYWAWYFFILCSITAVFLVLLFFRFFKAECERVSLVSDPCSGLNKQQFFISIVMLTILSIVMCIVLSIVGGIISTIISITGNVIPEDIPPETWLRMGFIRQGFSLLPSEILGRIPVNLVDKTISVFAGFGAAYLIKKLFVKKTENQ